MNTRILLLVFLLFGLIRQEATAQFGFSQEIGVITGPVAFYSDFGQRYSTENNLGNVGFGVGIIHYLNFSYRSDCNCYTADTYFNDHFKVRSEIDYHITNFDHHGEWVDPDRTSITADQLRAMKGRTKVFDIGAQLEWFPLSIRDFAAGSYKIAPFGSFGVHWVNFDPEIWSELGPLNTPVSTPPKYFNSFQQESDSTWSIVMSAGIRYKLAPLHDLMLDARWQYYFSNWVDGLNPSFENNGVVEVPENKANDWIFWLNVGYIYYLD